MKNNKEKKFDPFAYQNLFYEYDLNVTQDEINQVLFLVKDLKSSEQSTTFECLNILNFPILTNLKKQIIDILDNHQLFLRFNWAQLYNKNDQHSIHTHYGSYYSGILYLKGNNPSPTIFYDRLFEPYSYTFKKNQLLMFSSMIPHEVKPLKKNEERLIISFNTERKN
jgi:hypothetical protein